MSLARQVCSACRGTGVGYITDFGGGTDIGDCYYCKGNGWEYVRNEKGQFVKETGNETLGN